MRRFRSLDYSSMQPLLVVGATGTVGREVVSQLAAANAPVRAMSRNPDSADLPAGIEIVRGDLGDPASLDRPLRDVEAVFLVWTAPPAAVAPAIERIAQSARRIVFLSAPIRTPHPLFQQPNPSSTLMAHVEDCIQSSGLEWTFLRPGMFAANALAWWIPAIRTGNVIRWPFAETPTAPIHERDNAAVAVRMLLEEGHGGEEFVLTGPESLTHTQQVAIIGDVIGRPLRLEEISPAEARRELLRVIPAPAIEMLLNAWQAALGQPAHVTSSVAGILGRPPRTFREWATDHAADFPA